MLRMQDDGLIQLPPPRNGNNNGKPYLRRTPQAEPKNKDLVTTVAAMEDLRLELVTDRNQSHQWNEYIDRYHYLGYQPLPGAQLRYIAKANDQVLACLGFGAAAWKTAPRDNFIGWTYQQRNYSRHLWKNVFKEPVIKLLIGNCSDTHKVVVNLRLSIRLYSQ